MKKTWASNDSKEIISLAEDYYREDQELKRDLARTWEENIRFNEGDQFIRYNRETRGYEPIPNRVDGELMPKGIDNQLYKRVDIARSNLTRQEPIFNVTPNSSDPKDERLAKVSLAVNDARSEIDEDAEKRGEAADWAIATGNAVIKTPWCPVSKIEAIDENGKPVLDQNGNPIMIPMGDVQTFVISPFQFGVDKRATNLSNASVVFQYSIEKTADVKEWYGIQGPGYTGEALELENEEISSDNILKIDEDLKDFKIKGGKRVLEDCVILKEFYVKPDESLPYGKMVVTANGKLLYNSDSMYAKLNRRFWHPYSHFKYRSQPGKFWGVTPNTMGVKLQRRLNAIDTIIVLHRQTMGLGQWLLPKGSVKDGSQSGRVGLKIEYTSGPKGEKPEKIPASEIGQSVILEREAIVRAMDDCFGTTDILQGKTPSDSISGVSLEMVREMSFSRFNPMYQRWEKFNERISQLRLMLIAKKQKADNEAFTTILRRKLRSLTGLDIQQFIGSMIEDNTNIRITAGSTIPKSTAARQANLMKFGEAGLLGDLVKDPMRNQLFLNEFAIDNFKTITNVDWEKSKYELSQIEFGQTPIVHEKDDHQLHNDYFLSKLKDPSWYSSRHPKVIEAAWSHYYEHEKVMQQIATKQMSDQRAMMDESAYRQSLVNNGGPDGEPPSLDLFPSVIEDKMKMSQVSLFEGQQEGAPI